MLSDFLDRVLTKGGREPDGCGMSTRPAFYSGRGATTADLSESKLEKVWTAIKTHRGDEAAEAFVKMVESIKVLSATDFLLALESLDSSGFKWAPNLRPTARGLHAEDPITGLFTVLSVCYQGRDETRTIRDPFLRRRGRKIKPDPRGSYHDF